MPSDETVTKVPLGLDADVRLHSLSRYFIQSPVNICRYAVIINNIGIGVEIPGWLALWTTQRLRPLKRYRTSFWFFEL